MQGIRQNLAGFQGSGQEKIFAGDRGVCQCPQDAFSLKFFGNDSAFQSPFFQGGSGFWSDTDNVVML